MRAFIGRHKGAIWACLALLVAGVALLGQAIGRADLAAFSQDFRPMPPGAAAMAVLASAGALLVEGRRPGPALRILLAGAATLLALLWFLPGGPRISPFGALGHAGVLVALAGAASGRPWTWRSRQVSALGAALAAAVGTLVLFSYIAGVPLRYETALTPTSLPTSLVLFLIGHGLLVQAGSDTFPMSLFRLDRAELPSSSGQWLSRLPAVLFGLLAGLVCLAGALVMKGQAQASRQAAQEQLADLADYKTVTLQRWVEERLGDAEGVRQPGILQTHLAARLKRPAGASDDPGLRAWMVNLRKLYGYDSIALVGRDGRVVVQDGVCPVCGAPMAPMTLALAPGVACQAELKAQPCGVAAFSLGAPVFDGEGRPVGAVNLTMTADVFLRPFLRVWRGQGVAGETLLLVPGTGESMCLEGAAGPLRPVPARAGHLAGVVARSSALNLRVPRADHQPGLLVAVRPVPRLPWLLVLQQREADLVAQLRPRFWAIAAATLGTVLLMALGTGFLVRRYGGLRIREKLALEREHKALAERSRVLMQEANDIILVLDLEGRILDANQRAAAGYGYPKEVLLGMRGKDLRPAESAAGFDGTWQWLLKRGSGVWETLHRRSDGSVFPVEASSRVVALGGETYVLSFIRDISERHAQAREIRHLSQLYAALGQIGQAIVWTRGRTPLFFRICTVLVEFGQMRGAWVGAVDADGRLSQAGSAGDGPGPEAFQALDAGALAAVVRDGKPRIFEPGPAGEGSAAAFPVAQGGRVTHVLGVVAHDRGFFGAGEVQLLEETALDLAFALDKLDEEARRALAEEELRRAEAFTENLIRTASGILVGLDEAGRVVLLNDAATEITGYTREELQGSDWFETLVPRGRYPEVWATFKTLVATGAPKRFENPILAKDGTEKYISWQNSEVSRDGKVTGTISFGVETTQQRQALEEQKRLEAQLMQSQKMESLGSLAGGVAHDLNNVLGAILSLASAHREAGGLPAPVDKALETITTACLRGRDVVRSLLYFARKSLEAERPLELNVLVAEMADLLAHTTLKRVELRLDLEEGLPSILGDAAALSNAVMNLAVNAVDAMPGGGTLTLRTRRAGDGGQVLEVADTGQGMAPDVLRRAMEPFFTTKPQGKGTGLGLSMVFGTMKAHDGSLELDSRPGAGTTVYLRFPASRVMTSPPQAAAEAGQAGDGRARSVLVVDDDDLVREATVPMLEILGHRVHQAAGGEEALDLLREGLGVDLVILDMNMPGLSGAATLPKLLDLRPGLQVVLASGYSDQDLAELQAGRANVHCLHKPFSLGELRGLLAGLA